MSDGPLVHPTAIVDPSATLGAGARIWHFCHVMPEARIGAGAMLGQGCFVGRGVSIGERTRLQNNVSVFEGVSIAEDVFIGPSVVFTNVKSPRAFLPRRPRTADGLAPDGTRGDAPFEPTVVGRGATVGANATILPGLELGPFSFVGAGAVVSHSVPAFALVVGVPARRVGWVSESGARLSFENGVAVCPATGDRYQLDDDSVRREA